MLTSKCQKGTARKIWDNQKVQTQILLTGRWACQPLHHHPKDWNLCCLQCDADASAAPDSWIEPGLCPVCGVFRRSQVHDSVCTDYKFHSFNNLLGLLSQFWWGYFLTCKSDLRGCWKLQLGTWKFQLKLNALLITPDKDTYNVQTWNQSPKLK